MWPFKKKVAESLPNCICGGHMMLRKTDSYVMGWCSSADCCNYQIAMTEFVVIDAFIAFNIRNRIVTSKSNHR